MNQEVTYYPKEKILEAVEKFPTPFFIYKEKRIRENCRRLKEVFSKYFNFQPLYAVKANPNPEILRIILDEGFGLDCSAPSEIWISEKVKAKQGMFTGNYNSKEELASAKEAGLILNLDDISLIPVLEEIGVPDVISFRVNPGIAGKTELETNILAGPNAKFGVPYELAPEVYKQAKELGVKKFGIHMMTGSNMLDEEYFKEIVEKLFEIIADIKEKTGIEIDFMNIGGGIGVPYKPEEESFDLEKMAKQIRAVFDKQIEKYNLKEPQLMMEPGRFIMADAGWLVSRVGVIKDSYKKFAGLDASAHDMPRPSIYGAYHHLSVINDSKEKEKISVVGKICENSDQFARDRMLPKMKVGDIVVIHNCGGHARAMGHNYNGQLRHAEYLISSSGDIEEIRGSETFEDLFRNTSIGVGE